MTDVLLFITTLLARQSRLGCSLAVFVMVLVVPGVALQAQPVAVDSFATVFHAHTKYVASRQGNSIAAIEPSGSGAVIRNAFQFDEETAPLPDEFSELTVFAVSYYGSVYGWKKTQTGCEIIKFSEHGKISIFAVVGTSMECSIIRGMANVEDGVAVAYQDGTLQRLVLFAGGAEREMWSSTDSSVEKLDGFSLNDLNTLVFTVSVSTGKRRSYSSFFWVPAREITPITFPKAAGANVIVRDVNNRNQYLIALRASAAAATALYDPARNSFSRLTGRGERLAFSGKPFTSKAIFVSARQTVKVACFSKKKFKKAKISLLEVDAERDLIMALEGGSGSGSRLVRVVPLRERGYPSC